MIRTGRFPAMAALRGWKSPLPMYRNWSTMEDDGFDRGDVAAQHLSLELDAVIALAHEHLPAVGFQPRSHLRKHLDMLHGGDQADAVHQLGAAPSPVAR